MPYRYHVLSDAGPTEERFREALNDSGLLRRGALEAPPRSAAFTVFAQRKDATLDLAALRHNATHFFAAKVGLTVEKRYASDAAPDTDAARIVLAGDDGVTRGTRLCFGRPTNDDDLAAAEAAERLQGTGGLSLLAQRCPTIWLVVFETEADRVALTIAAILASVMLGPILSPDGTEIFGVRTARMKLEGVPRPYR